MDKHSIIDFLIANALVNYAILMVWFGAFIFGHDFMYRVHTRWFKMSHETFDAMNYAGMTVYKIGIMLFVLVPLIAMLLVS